jgi:hypothetical protein
MVAKGFTEIRLLVINRTIDAKRAYGPICALSVQTARNQSVRGKLERRLMRLTMDDQKLRRRKSRALASTRARA